MPVQIGSHVEMCSECGELKVCGEFWSIEPRCRWFWCLECLERMAAGVRAAMARDCVPTVRPA
jgi:hypothetical protein